MRLFLRGCALVFKTRLVAKMRLVFVFLLCLCLFVLGYEVGLGGVICCGSIMVGLVVLVGLRLVVGLVFMLRHLFYFGFFAFLCEARAFGLLFVFSLSRLVSLGFCLVFV